MDTSEEEAKEATKYAKKFETWTEGPFGAHKGMNSGLYTVYVPVGDLEQQVIEGMTYQQLCQLGTMVERMIREA